MDAPGGTRRSASDSARLYTARQSTVSRSSAAQMGDGRAGAPLEPEAESDLSMALWSTLEAGLARCQLSRPKRDGVALVFILRQQLEHQLWRSSNPWELLCDCETVLSLLFDLLGLKR
jgi:hypothetical protein